MLYGGGILVNAFVPFAGKKKETGLSNWVCCEIQVVSYYCCQALLNNSSFMFMFKPYTKPGTLHQRFKFCLRTCSKGLIFFSWLTLPRKVAMLSSLTLFGLPCQIHDFAEVEKVDTFKLQYLQEG